MRGFMVRRAGISHHHLILHLQRSSPPPPSWPGATVAVTEPAHACRLLFGLHPSHLSPSRGSRAGRCPFNGVRTVGSDHGGILGRSRSPLAAGPGDRHSLCWRFPRSSHSLLHPALLHWVLVDPRATVRPGSGEADGPRCHRDSHHLQRLPSRRLRHERGRARSTWHNVAAWQRQVSTSAGLPRIAFSGTSGISKPPMCTSSGLPGPLAVLFAEREGRHAEPRRF